ncbi:MAG TPA: iron-sulfur cluster assembly accessory protein [Gracilimonas sp.]|uniref:HesB/IscA family protein n=1 Tax=Gracilimonas sp. TaxID=1974203 RepID=UPI002D871716|nr:iron-sulfur cluster assembly accessory protein [Gracilimonas sp.]
MSVQEENLDDVISSLIDVDEEVDSSTPQPITEDDYQKNELTGEPVTLTERAAKQIEKIKNEESLDENLYLRVAVDGGGCSGLSYKLGLDHRTDEDKIFESHGMEIIVAPKHLMYLEGMQIDYPDGLDARGFTFDNPNAVENCGCGTSFAI